MVVAVLVAKQESAALVVVAMGVAVIQITVAEKLSFK